MMFTPDENKTEAKKVPFFEDARKEDGWQGHYTGKSIKALQSEIKSALGRMEGDVERFVSGTFEVNGQTRQGFQMLYIIPSPNGKLLKGRLDIAALPVRDKHNASKKERALRMALFMVIIALKGSWYLEVLAPGFSTLVPGLLIDGEGHTISDLYSQGMTDHLLPSGDSFQETIEGEVREI